MVEPGDRQCIHDELEGVRADLRALVEGASGPDLRRRTDGTRWTRPFHVVNYLGAVGGALVFHGPRLTGQLDRTLDRLHRRLDAETDPALGRRMHFPVDWDPFFRDTMTLREVYRYATQHYDFHRSQLTLEHSPGASRGGQ